jgi:hypothetical protein
MSEKYLKSQLSRRNGLKTMKRELKYIILPVGHLLKLLDPFVPDLCCYHPPHL